VPLGSIPQFQGPGNSTELKEIFLWKNQEEVETAEKEQQQKIADEFADVFVVNKFCRPLIIRVGKGCSERSAEDRFFGCFFHVYYINDDLMRFLAG
jgi:hypothetical protein